MCNPRRPLVERMILAVPVETALVYERGRGWHFKAAPPAWWLEEMDAAEDPALPDLVDAVLSGERPLKEVYAEAPRRKAGADHPGVGVSR